MESMRIWIHFQFIPAMIALSWFPRWKSIKFQILGFKIKIYHHWPFWRGQMLILTHTALFDSLTEQTGATGDAPDGDWHLPPSTSRLTSSAPPSSPSSPKFWSKHGDLSLHKLSSIRFISFSSPTHRSHQISNKINVDLVPAKHLN